MVPPAPIAVVALGVLIAFIVGAIGIRQLFKQGASSAAARADLLANTLAARVAEVPVDARHDLLDRAARRSGASIWLLDDSGNVLEDVSSAVYPIELPTGPTPQETFGSLITARGGEVKFKARGVPGGSVASPMHLTVVAAVDVPDPPDGERELIAALATLTGLLTSVAAAVAYAVARDVRLDVDDLGRRIHEIAARGRESTDRAQDNVPVQALDEVGELATAFNALVERFAVAEKTYADALARIEEIDRERSTFLATVSHELRTPLNAILGFADVLLSEVDGPLLGEAREEVAVIKQSGLHLLALINDILELSAIASGQLRLNRAEVDLVPIAEEVVREAIGARGDKPVALRVIARPKCPTFADGRRVRQILTNLVGNALKFTPRGEVVVSLDSDGHYVTIRVTDTGPGIPKEEREAIFAEYRQGGDRRARRRGTGLGLAIARRLALMHGGTIHVESEVGVGSTFVLRLPIRGGARMTTGLADDSGGFFAQGAT